MAGGKTAFRGSLNKAGEDPECVTDVESYCSALTQVAITTDTLRTSIFLHVDPLLGYISLPSNMICSKSSGLDMVSLGFKYECPKRQEVEIAKLKRSGHQIGKVSLLLYFTSTESIRFKVRGHLSNRVYQRMCEHLSTAVSFG